MSTKICVYACRGLHWSQGLRKRAVPFYNCIGADKGTRMHAHAHTHTHTYTHFENNQSRTRPEANSANGHWAVEVELLFRPNTMRSTWRTCSRHVRLSSFLQYRDGEAYPPPPYGKVPKNLYAPYACCSVDDAVAGAYHIHGELVQESGNAQISAKSEPCGFEWAKHSQKMCP